MTVQFCLFLNCIIIYTTTIRANLEVTVTEIPVQNESLLSLRHGNNLSDIVKNTSDMISAAECSQRNSQTATENATFQEGFNSTNHTLRSLLDNGLLSRDMYENVSGVLSHFTFPVLALALLCVVACIAVFSSPSMRTPTNSYLVFLACAELVYGICVLVVETTNTVYGNSAIHTKLYLQMAIYGGNYISLCSRRLAFCVTFLVTLERLFAVAFPLKLHQFRLLKSPKTLIPILTLILFSFHVYSPLKLEVIPEPGTNKTAHKISRTTTYLNNTSTFENLSIIGTVSFVFLPLFGCLLFNVIAVIFLCRQAKHRRSLHSSRIFHNERKTTVTIIVSTFIYVFLNLPVAISSMISQTVDVYGLGRREHYLFLLMNVVGYICEIMGTITNFTTYLVLSSNFRQVFYSFVCVCRENESRSRLSSRSRTLSIRSTELYAVRNSAFESDFINAGISVTVSETVN